MEVAHSRVLTVREAAIQTAQELADELLQELEAQTVMEWQFAFRLARRLRALEGMNDRDVGILKPALVAFCRQVVDGGGGAHIDFGDLEGRWLDFVWYWQTVEYPEGVGPLEIAFLRARRAPISTRQRWNDDFVLFASTAYHLQMMQGAEPILLPVERVGALFSRDKMYGSRLVSLATKAGLLSVVNPHRYVANKARTYRFVFESEAYTQPYQGVQAAAARTIPSTRPRSVS